MAFIAPRKKEERNIWKVIVLVTVAVMFLGSTIGFAFFSIRNSDSSSLNEQKYGEYKFRRTAQGWQTSVETLLGKLTLTTFFFPSQVLDVACDCDGMNAFSLRANKAYVIAISPEERQAALELVRNAAFSKVQAACLPKDANLIECDNLPLRSCEDASADTKVFIFKSIKKETENETLGASVVPNKAKYNNNCFILSGENLIKVADKIIYKAYGIIE